MSRRSGPEPGSGGAAERRRPGWWAAVLVGAGLMAWGVRLLLGATGDGGERVGFAVWLVLADVVVDWAVLPLIAAVGLGVRRWVPAGARVPVMTGLALSGTVLLVAWLPLRGTAEATGNATIQPLDYSRLVGTTLVLIWVAVGAWGLLRARWSRG